MCEEEGNNMGYEEGSDMDEGKRINMEKKRVM